MIHLVALGDSFTCGEGVGVHVPLAATWTALLAGAIPGAHHTSYATPGARVRDVRQYQVPKVSSATIVTLLVGLNDVARSGWDAGRVEGDLVSVADELCHRADTVLLVRLHDPVRLLWVPAPLRRLARERVAVVNAAVDRASRLPRVHVLDLARVELLRDRAVWAVDGVHPDPAGHVALAQAASAVLRDAGHLVGATPPVPQCRAASRRERAHWLARHGLPYLARNVRTLGTPALEGVLRRA